MSQPQPDVPVALPQSGAVDNGVHPTDALQHICALSHYLPGYAYRPYKHRYTETETTDPYYVVLEVRMMAPTLSHGTFRMQMNTALKMLTRAVTSEVHVSIDVQISGIPAAFFDSERHTSNVRPDLALWPRPTPDDDVSSYRYDRDGVPLLVVEVVSHSDREQRDNDWRHKMFTYARMGIREYWLVDPQQRSPLWGYTLDAADGTPYRLTTYRLIEADAEGGMASQVLNTSLRWAPEGIQCWQAPWEIWVPVEDLPAMQAALKGELKIWGRMLHRILDATAPGAADPVMQHWAYHPPQTWPSDETLDQLETTPEAWHRLLLGATIPHDDGS